MHNTMARLNGSTARTVCARVLPSRLPRGGIVRVAKEAAGVLAGAVFTLALVGVAWAELYSVRVTRIDADLYKTESKTYIQTRYCHEYAYGEKAILRYEAYDSDNKLIFDSGGSCEVVKVFK
jgi:hypothetical protein